MPPQFGQKKVFRRAGVSASAELRRIKDLPRRVWMDEIGDLCQVLTEAWKTPHGTQTLWPVQAIILAELHDFGGATGFLRTSAGKTLVSFLAALAVDAKRPLIIVPAALEAITIRKWKMLSEHWQLPEVYVYTYNKLSLEANKDFLHEYQPDIVIPDEAHKFKNPQAACTKRMAWFLADYPDTLFVPLTGTPTTRSIHDYAHIVRWSSPRMCPVPRNYGVTIEWGLCLDEIKSDTRSLGPGHLIELCNDRELELLKTEPLSAVRSAYQRRLTETPGIIVLADKGITVPLEVRAVDVDIDGIQEIDNAFRILRTKWATPDGRPFAEAVKLWSHCRELVTGFYYVWDPAPPKSWLRARTAWYRVVRHIISHNQRRLASEFQIALAFERGEYTYGEYQDWLAVRDTFKPNNVPVWVHTKTIELAQRWADKNPRGIIWTEHKAFARKLAEVSGLPYFGSKGQDAKGQMIEDASGPIIASVNSNKEGRDLQHKWDSNLIISCAPNGTVWEQMLARTHREGQNAKVVRVDVLLGCSEQYYGFRQAMRDAVYQQEIMGHPQKLVWADVTIPDESSIYSRRGMRWRKGVKK